MSKLLISVRDSKAETYTPPFAADNKATALREFATIVGDGRTLIGQHPEDFDIFVIGVFDTLSGKVEPRVPEHLANGLDFVKKDK